MTQQTLLCPWHTEHLVAFHRFRWPLQNESLAQFVTQLQEEPESILKRSTMRGHVTGSCLIIDQSSMCALEILHNASGLWLPPGGHVDLGETPRQAALREALEEVGVNVATMRPFFGLGAGGGLLDIDTHPISGNTFKKEGAHRHHDCAFAFMTQSRVDFKLAKNEVSRARWQPIAKMLRSTDSRSRRLGAKLISLASIDGHSQVA